MNRGEAERNARIARMTDRALLSYLATETMNNPEELSTEECSTFADIFASLDLAKGNVMTKSERAHAEEVARRITPLKASEVPIGRRVETPEVLKVLPKKPPGRRVSE